MEKVISCRVMLLARLIVELTNSDSKVLRVSNETPRSQISEIGKFQKDLGYRPKPLRQHLLELIEHMRVCDQEVSL